MEYDFQQLNPGDEILQSDCEQMIELAASHRDYSMRLVSLCKEAEANLWRIGKCYTLRCVNNGIRVLTHAEASQYGDELFEHGKRKMRLAHKRKIAVDTSGFNEQQRRDHFEGIAKQSRMISFMRKRTAIKLDAVIKTTPARDI